MQAVTEPEKPSSVPKAGSKVLSSQVSSGAPEPGVCWSKGIWARKASLGQVSVVQLVLVCGPVASCHYLDIGR